MKDVAFFLRKSFYLLVGLALLGVFAFLFPDDESVLQGYFSRGDYAEALQIVRSRLQEDSEDVLALEYRARINLAYSLQHAGYLDQLESEYLIRSAESFLILLGLEDVQERLGKKYSQICFLFGFNCFLQGEYQNALKYVDLSIETSPDFADLLDFIEENDLGLFVNGERYSLFPYSLRGYLAYKTQDYHKAIQSFLKVIEDTPEDQGMIYHFYLARSYDAVALVSEAIEEYRRVIVKEERVFVRFRACVLLSDLFFRQKDYGNAQKYLYQAQFIQPSADVLYRLGVIYEKQGKLSFARSKWKRALRLNPDHDLSRLKLTRFGVK